MISMSFHKAFIHTVNLFHSNSKYAADSAVFILTRNLQLCLKYTEHNLVWHKTSVKLKRRSEEIKFKITHLFISFLFVETSIEVKHLVIGFKISSSCNDGCFSFNSAFSFMDVI